VNSINKNKKKVLFVFTIDAEEEWDWSGSFPQRDFSVDNIQLLDKFQLMCEGLGIRPTYFVDYAVAENPAAAAVLQPTVAEQRCEIGAHLHPWCNPPFYGAVGEHESHVVNLPIEQTEEKLKQLVEKLTGVFGVVPRSFRTGRWGIDSNVIQLLVKYGFSIDSSVYTYYRHSFFSHYNTPNLPYWADLDRPLAAGNDKQILEFPVTAGFNHPNFALCERLYSLISHPGLSWSHLVGMSWNLHMLRKTCLSPELFEPQDMLTLCQAALKNDYPVLHMFMHSSCLIENNNSLVGNRNAYDYICDAIRYLIQQLQEQADLEFCTISEAAEKLKQDGQL
jgi:hypothetical protein